MKTALFGKRKETLEDGVIQSLCYLHQETLKENLQELAGVIQTAIEQTEQIIPASVSLSRDSKDLLSSFTFFEVSWPLMPYKRNCSSGR